MRLIDADVLKKEFPKDTDWEYPVNTNEYVCEKIDEQPTVEPPTTEWLGNHTPFRCKRCGHYSDTRTPYCAYCGKKANNYE